MRSLFFFAGDLLTAVLTGAATGLACAALISDAWPGFVAMLVGMLIGMVLSLPISTILGIWFGAFEVMTPCMLAGMVVGMSVAMSAAAGEMNYAAASTVGAGLGVLCLAFCMGADWLLRGEETRWTS